MLYKLNTTDGKYNRLDPLPFKDFSNFGKLDGSNATFFVAGNSCLKSM
jgi:hypothetical protein